MSNNHMYIILGNPTIIIQKDFRLVALRPYLSISLPLTFAEKVVLISC